MQLSKSQFRSLNDTILTRYRTLLPISPHPSLIVQYDFTSEKCSEGSLRAIIIESIDNELHTDELRARVNGTREYTRQLYLRHLDIEKRGFEFVNISEKHIEVYKAFLGEETWKKLFPKEEKIFPKDFENEMWFICYYFDIDDAQNRESNKVKGFYVCCDYKHQQISIPYAVSKMSYSGKIHETVNNVYLTLKATKTKQERNLSIVLGRNMLAFNERELTIGCLLTTDMSFNSTSGPVVFQRILEKPKDVKDIDSIQIPTAINYFLEGKICITKHSAVSDIKKLNRKLEKELSELKKRKEVLLKMEGLYELYTLSTSNRQLVKLHLEFDKEGRIRGNSSDTTTSKYRGHIRFANDRFWHIILEKTTTSRYDIWLNAVENNDEICKGIYGGFSGDEPSAGRIYLRKIKVENVEDLKHENIKINSPAYENLKSKIPDLIDFMQGRQDKKIDDVNLLNKNYLLIDSEEDLKPYVGGYCLLFTEPDSGQRIARRRLEIKEDSTILYRTDVGCYEGRAFIVGSHLCIHVYRYNHQKYEGSIIMYIGRSQGRAMFTGTYCHRNDDDYCVAGKVILYRDRENEKKDFAIGFFDFRNKKETDLLEKHYKGSVQYLRGQFNNFIKIGKQIWNDIENEKQYCELLFESACYHASKKHTMEVIRQFKKALKHGFNNDDLLEEEMDREDGALFHLPTKTKRELKACFHDYNPTV